MFAGLLPMLLKNTKKHVTISERKFSVGAITEGIQRLCSGGVLGGHVSGHGGRRCVRARGDVAVGRAGDWAA